MEYIIGVVLGFVVGAIGTIMGFDREKSFYATVMIVIAAYYVLFAAMGGTGQVIVAEIIAGSVFLILALYGSRKSLWIIVGAIVGHGLFDSVHHLLIENPGVPRWWPGFCGTIDVVIGVWLSVRLKMLGKDAVPAASR